MIDGTDLEKLKGKNWMATMVLCWMFGTIGGHRFYTGKSKSAWAMLAMTITCCLAPISAIWALVDGVVIALGQFKHADGDELYERIPWFGYTYLIVMGLIILSSLLYMLLIFVGFAAAVHSGLGAAGSAAVTPAP